MLLNKWASPLALVFGLSLCGWAGAQTYVGIPEVSDPPPSINGSLDRLSKLPGWATISGADHVVFGKETWKDDADLSATAVLGWRTEFLYVAAKVKDNVVVQPYTGSNIWKGDHVMLVLDVPRQSGLRDKQKVYQIGLSPGNFKTGSDAIAPAVYEWAPNAGSIPGARIGVQKTEDGYMIEAAIPWEALHVKPADLKRGFQIGYDIEPSDADNKTDPQQDKLMSLIAGGNWTLRDPNRLVEGVLAGTDAKVDPSWIKSAFDLVKSDIKVGPESTVKIPVGPKFDKKPIKELIVRARIENKTIAGGNVLMSVALNGQPLKFDRIRNRLMRIQMGSREIASYGAGGASWFVFYGPDYTPAPSYSGYATPGIDQFEFRFDVSDLWKKDGGNVIEIGDTSTLKTPLIAEVGVSEALSPKMEPPKLKPAPTGPLTTFLPVTEAKPDYSFQQLGGGAILVKLGDQKWVIDSQFSTTAPGWAKLAAQQESKSQWTSLKVNGSNLTATARDFKVDRTITRHDDHLQIVDRITNTTDADLPVMFSHQTTVDRKNGELYVAGLKTTLPKLLSDEGARPTIWIGWDKSALGWVAEDDITRAQGEEFVDEDTIGIRDRRLVVGKGKTVELEYSVYPLETADRFAFINRIRRNWDVNFQINGGFAFVASYGPIFNLEMTDEHLKAWLKNKAVHYVSGTLFDYVWGPEAPQPNPTDAWSNESRQKMFDRIKAVRPDISRLIYYHCYIGYQETDTRAMKFLKEVLIPRYYKDRTLRPDGVQADYSNPLWPLFMPIEGSGWAKVQEEQLDHILKKTGLEGVYWDEIAYSAFKYDYNPAHWDGVSADIDPNTHKIARKITNVTLATQPWRLRIANKIMSKYDLIGNGAPMTRSFSKLHFPRFVETGNFSSIITSQLYTPIGLGDHLTERNEVDAYRDMVRQLDYGAVYYWYRREIDATHPTLTSYMYPITPINLGHGFIIAKERILTNRSGEFGWGDDSQFKTYVFDDRGNQTDKIKIPRIEKDGKAFAQVRIPEDYTVAIVREAR
jgi:hypothetical protein